MTTRVKGTLGYLAPEYAMWGKVSECCDVYSFGILLLELVSGRKPIEKLPGGVKRTITEWAEPLISSSRLSDIVDPRLNSVFDEQELRRILHAAARSVQSDPERRPTMSQVLDILTGTAAAGDPIKNGALSSVEDERDGNVHDVEVDYGGRTSSAGRAGTLRMESIKYGRELLDMDDDDNSNDGDVEDEDGEREPETTSASSMEGVAVQKMRDNGNYGQYDVAGGGRRPAIRG